MLADKVYNNDNKLGSIYMELMKLRLGKIN
jgi:hypothetical protein